MDSYMAGDLLRWRKTCAYPQDSDWVFASPTMKGKQLYWPDNLMKRYIKPAAKKAGIHKNVGWQTSAIPSALGLPHRGNRRQASRSQRKGS